MEQNCLNEIITYIKYADKQISNISICIAKQVHFVYTCDLYKNKYADIYDFCNSLNISRKTTNFYLNVIERFFIYNYNLDTKCYEDRFYTIKDNVIGFNFSQLKTLLGLSDDEIEFLEINNQMSVREIERIKKEFHVSQNSHIFSDCSGVPPDQSENEQIEFESYNDKIKNINCFELGYIPSNSEYEIIFDGNNSMIKGYKAYRNINTSLKHLRQDIENNIDNDVLYAVVKIKRSK